MGFRSGLAKTVVSVKSAVTNVAKSDVAETMIATWCIEFLRVRKVGGLNVVQVIVISALMLGVKTILKEADRRKSEDVEFKPRR